MHLCTIFFDDKNDQSLKYIFNAHFKFYLKRKYLNLFVFEFV